MSQIKVNSIVPAGGLAGASGGSFTPTTSTINVYCTTNAGSPTDRSIVNVAVFH